MSLGLMAALGLLIFFAGAWLIRQQKLNAQGDPSLSSLPAPIDLGDFLMRIVAYACVGGGALLFLGALIGLVFVTLG